MWDGYQFVSHEGLINKGTQDTILIDGVYCTPDHKILTENGWQNASSCEGLNRASFKLPYGNKLPQVGWEKITVENSMYLRMAISRSASIGTLSFRVRSMYLI